jgi:hypothetical protein
MRKTVSTTFRNIIEEYYPGLNLKPTYWRFMRCLIFGPKDTITGLSLINGYHIAKAEGAVLAFRANNHTGRNFLEDFQRDVMTRQTFSWSGWNYENKQARIAYVIFPQEINTLITKEITNTTKNKVYFDTGLAVTKARAKTQRELIKLEADTYFEFAVPEAKPLLKYMNNLPTHNFSKVIEKNWDIAWSKVSKIKDPLKFRVQVEVLMTLREDLQPFYKPSENGCTPRIFPCNYSIPMLRRDIRKTLTQGWYEFDLASSQLAIVAKEWNITIVQDFLKSNKSIWTELFRHFGFNATQLKEVDNLKYQGIKDVFKTSLYSLIYGMQKGYLIKTINQDLKVFNIVQGGKHYFNHPLIQSLYLARELKFKELNELQEVSTIFGRTIEIEGSKTFKGTPTKERRHCIGSILAHQAQAIELYLLLPVVELASTTKDFYITLWQHDGFSLHFTNKTKIDRWIPRILKVVQDKIDQQDILTHLDWELL